MLFAEFLVEGAQATGLPFYIEIFSVGAKEESLSVESLSVVGVCNGKRRRFRIAYLRWLDGRFYIYCLADRFRRESKTLLVCPLR